MRCRHDVRCSRGWRRGWRSDGAPWRRDCRGSRDQGPELRLLREVGRAPAGGGLSGDGDRGTREPVKARLGVPRDLFSCHTALVGGHVIEGHVPAGAIKRLLAENLGDRAGRAGHAGRVARHGGRGMEPDTYDVVLFGKGGTVDVLTVPGRGHRVIGRGDATLYAGPPLPPRGPTPLRKGDLRKPQGRCRPGLGRSNASMIGQGPAAPVPAGVLQPRQRAPGSQQLRDAGVQRRDALTGEVPGPGAVVVASSSMSSAICSSVNPAAWAERMKQRRRRSSPS